MTLPSSATLPPPGLAVAFADALAGLDMDAVVAQAQALHRAAVRGEGVPLLRGRRLALLCALDGQPEAVRFERAAQALGARVTRLTPPLDLDPAHDWRPTARVLGRLYDAIECQGLPARVVAELMLTAGVPVCNGLASTADTITECADRLIEGTLEERRHLVLQAALALALR